MPKHHFVAKYRLQCANYILFLTPLIVIFYAQNVTAQSADNSTTINIVFTSDAHYGISRDEFRAHKDVPAHEVNAAMVKEINFLPNLSLPDDDGVSAGKKIEAVDYLVEGGDIANRMEVPIQSAAASWAQFKTDYIDGLTLKAHNGTAAQLLIVPGNHDISNAIGFYKQMNPATDATSMTNIYNMMLKPQTIITPENYDYNTEKINYSKFIGGVHFMFITLWADSAERIWMQQDLDSVAATTPVIIFTHDQPTCDAKHFTNPQAPHDINSKSKFENLVAENYKEGTNAKSSDGNTDMEQRGFVTFLKAHPNIKAYFHGNSNWNEFYVYKGPDKDVHLNTFRVDSPMKGKESAKDETKLSFHLISLDPKTQTLTVRECLWNTDPSDKSPQVVFGKSRTISLRS